MTSRSAIAVHVVQILRQMERSNMTMHNNMLKMTGMLAFAFGIAVCNGAEVTVDASSAVGPVKPVNAVGQPPMIDAIGSAPLFHYLKDAGIPYSRLHDVGGWLGGGLYVDIPNIFPDFDADETNPESYRFQFTDALLKNLEKYDVEPFFRLGVTIENFVTYGKTGTFPPVNILPPKDPAKWARICEHVIRHYTEGWANGYRMKITYWEIWNEPENHPDAMRNPMFRGSFEEYMKLYGVAATHLKKCFPHIKIGGYGHCGFYAGVGSDRVPAANSSPRMEYFVDCSHKFLAAARDNGWPLDFFSYHSYSDPKEAMRQVRFADEHLNEYGFTSDKCERIFNEWLPFVGHKNLGTALQASAVAAELIALQNGPCDLACIYDARCGVGNYSPLFNPLTYEPHKAYYAFMAFNELRKLGTAVACKSTDPNLYAAAAAHEGRIAVMLANYSGRAIPLSVKGAEGATECRLTDDVRTYESVPLPAALPPRSFAVLTTPERAEVPQVPARQNLDMPDSRARVYVSPVRVVWERGAQNADRFLAPKHGQVCETGFAKSVGARLLNDGGDTPCVVLDFGRELHGGLQLGMSPKATKGSRVRVRFGESVSETMSSVGGEKNATNDHAMRDFELSVPSFGTIEVGSTGFRFVRIDLVTKGEVGFEFVRAVSLMRRMRQIGSFRSSDERLNRIFDVAVRTVHLCCQDNVWDGIKRDRLVWLGDMHPETMAILNVFGAASVIPETLDFAMATTKPDEWMNTICTYTAWFLRCVRAWRDYTGDNAFVRERGDYLKRTIEHSLATDGLNPTSSMGGFLDWPTHSDKDAEAAGSRALWALAFDDAAVLADVLGDSALAGRCRDSAAKIRATAFDPHGAKSSAALLALAGVADPKEMFAKVIGENGHSGVSTFYGYYMLEAMSAAGENQRALDTVRDYWGGMLDMGATSFWEDFSLTWTNNAFRIDEMPVADKRDIHGEFGAYCYKGFRHSLCHGWSAGPASWCINHVLGIQPVEVGCRVVKVAPFLGDLEWAEGAMALPDGCTVKVRAEKSEDGKVRVKVDAPPKVRIVTAE